MHKSIAIMVIILLGAFCITIYNAYHKILVETPLLNIGLLKKFLENQYIAEIGLLRAAVHAYPDNVTIYIANDNLLAARALAVLKSPLASRIITKLNNEFNGGWNGKIDILLGKDIPDTFYASYNELIGKVNGYMIIYEKLNYSQPIYDWYSYADLLVYYALDKLLCRSRSEAEQSFLNLTRMWDGYGFKDKAYNEMRVYLVYKCALFIYLYRALDIAGSEVVHGYREIHDKCIKIIIKAQDLVKGGIHTDYIVNNDEVIIMGDVNTETTSIVVLALYSNYPEIIGLKARPNH